MNAQDVKRPKAFPITLDKERTIKFDLNSFIELEDMYGSIDTALAELDKMNVKAVRAILWAGLIHEDEALTLKQVGSLVGLADLQGVANALGQGIVSAMPSQVAELQPDDTEMRTLPTGEGTPEGNPTTDGTGPGSSTLEQ